MEFEILRSHKEIQLIIYCEFIKDLTNVLYELHNFVIPSVTDDDGETIEPLKEGKILAIRSGLLIEEYKDTESVLI